MSKLGRRPTAQRHETVDGPAATRQSDADAQAPGHPLVAALVPKPATPPPSPRSAVAAALVQLAHEGRIVRVVEGARPAARRRVELHHPRPVHLAVADGVASAAAG